MQRNFRDNAIISVWRTGVSVCPARHVRRPRRLRHRLRALHGCCSILDVTDDTRVEATWRWVGACEEARGQRPEAMATATSYGR